MRLAQAPLYFRLAGAPQLPPGRRIVVDVLSRDEVDLSIEARFVDLAAPVPEAAGSGLTAAEADEAEFAEE
jgi:exoribonuclease-2